MNAQIELLKGQFQKLEDTVKAQQTQIEQLQRNCKRNEETIMKTLNILAGKGK